MPSTLKKPMTPRQFVVGISLTTVWVFGSAGWFLYTLMKVPLRW